VKPFLALNFGPDVPKVCTRAKLRSFTFRDAPCPQDQVSHADNNCYGSCDSDFNHIYTTWTKPKREAAKARELFKQSSSRTALSWQIPLNSDDYRLYSKIDMRFGSGFSFRYNFKHVDSKEYRVNEHKLKSPYALYEWDAAYKNGQSRVNEFKRILDQPGSGWRESHGVGSTCVAKCPTEHKGVFGCKIDLPEFDRVPKVAVSACPDGTANILGKCLGFEKSGAASCGGDERYAPESWSPFCYLKGDNNGCPHGDRLPKPKMNGELFEWSWVRCGVWCASSKWQCFLKIASVIWSAISVATKLSGLVASFGSSGAATVLGNLATAAAKKVAVATVRLVAMMAIRAIIDQYRQRYAETAASINAERVSNDPKALPLPLQSAEKVDDAFWREAYKACLNTNELSKEGHDLPTLVKNYAAAAAAAAKKLDFTFGETGEIETEDHVTLFEGDNSADLNAIFAAAAATYLDGTTGPALKSGLIQYCMDKKKKAQDLMALSEAVDGQHNEEQIGLAGRGYDGLKNEAKKLLVETLVAIDPTGLLDFYKQFMEESCHGNWGAAPRTAAEIAASEATFVDKLKAANIKNFAMKYKADKARIAIAGTEADTKAARTIADMREENKRKQAAAFAADNVEKAAEAKPAAAF